MELFGGTFAGDSASVYLTEGYNNASQSEARVQFTFLTDSDGGAVFWPGADISPAAIGGTASQPPRSVGLRTTCVMKA